jgi:hypothetical protein
MGLRDMNALLVDVVLAPTMGKDRAAIQDRSIH